MNKDSSDSRSLGTLEKGFSALKLVSSVNSFVRAMEIQNHFGEGDLSQGLFVNELCYTFTLVMKRQRSLGGISG